MAKTKIHYPQWKPQSASPTLRANRHRMMEAIALTAEACGHALSLPAAEMLADDLAHFDDAVILAALTRCRYELDAPLRIAEILARIDDGRPDADEAWAMMPIDERVSVVWTEEMAQAWGAAQPSLDAGDAATAQSVFRKMYEKLVLDARIRREAPRWIPSLGLDIIGRETALREAVVQGRASAAQAELLLGHALDLPEAEEMEAAMKSLH